MKLGIQKVMLASLIKPNWLETEMRVHINGAKVLQYADEKKLGDKFPPPLVLLDPRSEVMRVGDGFHRILAAKENGDKAVECDVQRGNLFDAILKNIECNRMQKGMPFSTGDKRKAIEALLRNPVSGAWSQVRIADTVGSSPAYVCQVAGWIDANKPEFIECSNGKMKRRGMSHKSNEVAARRKEIMALIEKGLAQIEVSRRTGYGRSTIQRHIEASIKEKDFVTCPHCKGAGIVRAS